MCSFLRIRSHLLKEFLMENFVFCSMDWFIFAQEILEIKLYFFVQCSLLVLLVVNVRCHATLLLQLSPEYEECLLEIAEKSKGIQTKPSR